MDKFKTSKKNQKVSDSASPTNNTNYPENINNMSINTQNYEVEVHSKDSSVAFEKCHDTFRR